MSAMGAEVSDEGSPSVFTGLVKSMTSVRGFVAPFCFSGGFGVGSKLIISLVGLLSCFIVGTAWFSLVKALLTATDTFCWLCEFMDDSIVEFSLLSELFCAISRPLQLDSSRLSSLLLTPFRSPLMALKNWTTLFIR